MWMWMCAYVDVDVYIDVDAYVRVSEKFYSEQ